jgi:hypothetical protein
LRVWMQVKEASEILLSIWRRPLINLNRVNIADSSHQLKTDAEPA